MFSNTHSTTPKPFIFVLMPFRQEFDDIYKFGIKGAAEDVGAYAERVDEQIYGEGILDRIYNQINKADVIVADMTGQNPNVFYEVGYAHALGKIVLLLTENADDIPFDLKHRPHIVYGGKIHKLKEELCRHLEWALGELRKHSASRAVERYKVTQKGTHIPESSAVEEATLFIKHGYKLPDNEETIYYPFYIQVLNNSVDVIPPTSELFLITTTDCAVELREETASPPLTSCSVNPTDPDDCFVRQYKLSATLPPLLPGAAETIRLRFEIPIEKIGHEELFSFRIGSIDRVHSFNFRLKILEPEPPDPFEHLLRKPNVIY